MADNLFLMIGTVEAFAIIVTALVISEKRVLSFAFQSTTAMKKQIVVTDKGPAPIGPYSQAVNTGDMLFISGQVAKDAITGELITADTASETRKVMENLQAILSAAGYDFTQVVKTTIFLSDMKLFTAVNEVYGSFFKGDYPARETVAVSGLPLNVNVEISMIACR